MTAYYNEHDPFAAAWLRNLIAAGMIAPGDVDERSVEDVIPLELHKYSQVHLFAGIGVWSYAMRNAGFADSRRGWSCSCPCQPFSQSGKGAGFADERHLWPAAFHLIEQCRPDIVFGEQVSSPDGIAWLDLVQTDMEARNFTFGAIISPAAGYGAPHIRHRTYWVAYADHARPQGRGERGHSTEQRIAWPRSVVDGLADANGKQRRLSEFTERPPSFEAVWRGEAGEFNAIIEPRIGHNSRSELERPGPTNGVWGIADWLRCKDDAWRPVEPGAFPLVDGAVNRVGLLRGYGNAIVAPQAEEFVRAAMAYAP